MGQNEAKVIVPKLYKLSQTYNLIHNRSRNVYLVNKNIYSLVIFYDLLINDWYLKILVVYELGSNLASVTYSSLIHFLLV